MRLAICQAGWEVHGDIFIGCVDTTADGLGIKAGGILGIFYPPFAVDHRCVYEISGSSAITHSRAMTRTYMTASNDGLDRQELIRAISDAIYAAICFNIETLTRCTVRFGLSTVHWLTAIGICIELLGITAICGRLPTVCALFAGVISGDIWVAVIGIISCPVFAGQALILGTDVSIVVSIAVDGIFAIHRRITGTISARVCVSIFACAIPTGI